MVNIMRTYSSKMTIFGQKESVLSRSQWDCALVRIALSNFNEFGCKLLPYPPYLPDLVPHLFPVTRLEIWFDEERFGSIGWTSIFHIISKGSKLGRRGWKSNETTLAN